MLVPEKLEGKNIIIRHLEKDDFLGYKGFMQNQNLPHILCIVRHKNPMMV